MTENPKTNSAIEAKRSDLQIPRRLFHFGSGVIVAFLYQTLFTHSQAVYVLGFLACMVYIFEQVRVNYPEFASRFNHFSKYVLRAEEQLKESAQVPYLMGMLLTILSFPKPVAIAGVLTLAIADPLSALIGIRFGKNRIVPHKSLEGSAAFFIATIFCVMTAFMTFHSEDVVTSHLVGLAILVALLASLFEMIPIKIDDNLTIPIFTALVTWAGAVIFGIPTI